MRHLLALLVIVWLVTPARAAELVILAPNPFTPVLGELIPGIQARSHDHVTVVRDTAGGLAKRIAEGQAFDVALLNQSAVGGLAARLRPGSARPVARSGIGLAVPDGAPVPDIRTVDGFVRTLRAARAIAYTDPAAGGTSGIYLAGLFQRLGIGDVVRAKAVLVPGGLAAERLVTGEASVALQQAPEVMAVKGAHYVGPIPSELQSYTVYVGAIAQASPQPAAARLVLEALRGPAGTASLVRHGLERP